jgi:cephalosporin hydroxylase
MKNISLLEKYVRKKRNKDKKSLTKAAWNWIKEFERNRLSYELSWMGMPIIQTSEDLILMQELIFKVQPDVIIETGIAHGGSLIYYASLMELLGKGRVIGIDIEIRPHNRKVIEKHPFFKRVSMIQMSSVDEAIMPLLKKKISNREIVMVLLDSNHTRDHVLAELKLYERLVSKNSYMVVFDTRASSLAQVGICKSVYRKNGPSEAIASFLEENKKFEVDRSYNKLFVSYTLDGFLKRVR